MIAHLFINSSTNLNKNGEDESENEEVSPRSTRSNLSLSAQSSPMTLSHSTSNSQLEVNSIIPVVQPLTTKETAILSSQFCILWYLSNLVTNASLSYTSVSSQTMLASTSSFFTLIIGHWFQVESITRSKLIALVISFIGIGLVSKSDSSTSPTDNDNYTAPQLKLFGNLLALAGAALYGLYTTMLKIRIKDESRINMKLFFGFVGIFNIILLWPSLIILHFTGYEKFELPGSAKIWFILGLNIATTFISDYCWVLSMLMTSPLTVTVGLAITIPLAMFGDLIFKHAFGGFVYYFGALLIIISFIMINRADRKDVVQMDVQTIQSGEAM